MSRIAVHQDQSIEPIHAAGSEVWIQHAFVIPDRSGVEQPVPVRRAKMHRRAGPKIEDVDFQNGAARPVRMFEVKMAARDLGEEMHRAEDEFRQRPVAVVEHD